MLDPVAGAAHVVPLDSKLLAHDALLLNISNGKGWEKQWYA